MSLVDLQGPMICQTAALAFWRQVSACRMGPAVLDIQCPFRSSPRIDTEFLTLVAVGRDSGFGGEMIVEANRPVQAKMPLLKLEHRGRPKPPASAARGLRMRTLTNFPRPCSPEPRVLRQQQRPRDLEACVATGRGLRGAEATDRIFRSDVQPDA